VSDAQVIGRLLDEYHERSVRPAAIQIVAGSVHEGRIGYEVTMADGGQQLLRAFRADGAVPVHGVGPFTETVTDWLVGRAETLAVLATGGYPAPRPVPARTGELIAVAGPWLGWATTYIAGAVLSPTLDELHALGSSLGQLHRVLAGGGGRRLASRHPAIAVPMTLDRLDSVADKMPGKWEPMAAAFRQTVLAVHAAASSLPETVVHGDVWARNAVQPASGGPVVLIDWETCGLGLGVLDLGNALLECHLDSTVSDLAPAEWLISPDESRIAALARGYASARPLAGAELAMLPDAVRFTAAVVGATDLEMAFGQGVTGPAMHGRLARQHNRLDVSDEVAALAAPHLT
jgi:Ser/Thr protein kinase RdoA (MazF antagonist)